MSSSKYMSGIIIVVTFLCACILFSTALLYGAGSQYTMYKRLQRCMVSSASGCKSAAPAPFPIDVVTLWVDGTDAAWRQGVKEARAAAGGDKMHDHDLSRDPVVSIVGIYDELYYSIRSVILNMPFTRTVYIVTQRPHRPAWLTDSPTFKNIVVIHHDEFFDARVVRPTYNSNVIEAQVCRISGLAEHFILLNDDLFITLPTRANDFFDSAGKPIVPHRDVRELRPSAWRRCLDYGGMLSRCLAYNGTFAYTPHVPVPVRKTDMARLLQFFENDVLRMQPLRTTADFSLHNIASNVFADANSRITYMYYSSDAHFKHDRNIYDTVCINDGFGDGCRKRLGELLDMAEEVAQRSKATPVMEESTEGDGEEAANNASDDADGDNE